MTDNYKKESIITDVVSVLLKRRYALTSYMFGTMMFERIKGKEKQQVFFCTNSMLFFVYAEIDGKDAIIDEMSIPYEHISLESLYSEGSYICNDKKQRWSLRDGRKSNWGDLYTKGARA